jgi:NADH:ubiquinone oxidoreductase subunit E
LATATSPADYTSLLAPFEPNKGHLLPALHAIQHEYGWISKDGIRAVAKQLKMTDAQVYGALSFYSEFRTTPPPHTLIAWCSGPACRLLGGERIRETLERELGIRLLQQTADGQVGLHLGQCNGTCHEAPQVWVNGEVVGCLTEQKTVQLVRDIKESKL